MQGCRATDDDQINDYNMEETYSTFGEMRNLCDIFVRNGEGKTPPRKHRHRWENNIKINLKEIRCEKAD
jgi:hypothetical protein